jgi:cytochrome c oxidase cbb3-type subunit 3
MYKETLRGIAGVGVFPAASLLLFVLVFLIVLYRVFRMDQEMARTMAGLPLDDGAARRDELLDHDADGIREFDNDLPRWWLYGFYLTIAFSVVYMINYHVMASPLFGQPGMEAEYREEMLAAEKAAQPSEAGAGSGAALTPLTDSASLAAGQGIFEGAANVCASCHRPDLGGLIGPNLTDDYWLHGCTVQEIVKSIRTGYPQKGMLPYGTGKTLTDEELIQVASYVIAKRGSVPPAPKPVEAGRDTKCR